MKYIDEVSLTHKTILLRVDFNVSLNPNHTISNDTRIQQSLPTIKYLISHHNKIILLAHLGESKGRDKKYSLSPVAKRLREYLPQHKIRLVDDFLTQQELFANQPTNEVLLLENIRFYPGEKTNDPGFAKQLAALGDTYVNDAFGVSHRKHASVVELPSLLPAYGGLLLKKEITMLETVMKHPHKPYVAIIGGMKIGTKIRFIKKLTTLADYILLGGGLANTFLAAQGHHMGRSLVSHEDIGLAKEILVLAKSKHVEILLPRDVVVAKEKTDQESTVKKIDEIKDHDGIFDIGPETQADFGEVIDKAKTLIWNGPVGYMENQAFKRGTDFLYYAITQNEKTISVVGGGDTLAAITNKEYLNKITHISTGGGAMLEFIENGTLPGIEALTKKQTKK